MNATARCDDLDGDEGGGDGDYATATATDIESQTTAAVVEKEKEDDSFFGGGGFAEEKHSATSNNNDDDEKSARNKETVFDIHWPADTPRRRAKSLSHLTNEIPYLHSFRMPHAPMSQQQVNDAAVAARSSTYSDAASTTGAKCDYNFVLDNYVEYMDETKIPRLRGKDDSNKLIAAIHSSHWAALCVVATTSCVLTYSISNHPPLLRADLAQAIVITIVLATFPEVAASAGAGAFAGMASLDTIPNYGWLALLALITSAVWTTFHHFKLLVGFGGRLGTCAFISMNITVAVFIMPSGVVPWSFYGNVHELWSEQLELVPSILSVVACMFLSAVGGAVRLNSKLPLNPVQAPTSIALLCMLILEPTGWKYTTQTDAGLAVGSFVAMASEQYLPSVLDFGAAGFLAGLWILFLDPFFLDFGGKKGFTSLCGFVTYIVISKVVPESMRRVKKER